MPEAPWDVISMDFIVKLLESHGYDTIMNVVNNVTKRAHFIPPSMLKAQLSYSLRRSGNTMGRLE
jgi:hypothetical protein